MEEVERKTLGGSWLSNECQWGSTRAPVAPCGNRYGFRVILRMKIYQKHPYIGLSFDTLVRHELAMLVGESTYRRATYDVEHFDDFCFRPCLRRKPCSV